MNTLNKPPLPNFTVTTIRPVFGCLGSDSKIDQENRILDEERNKVIVDFHNRLSKYRKDKANFS